jgi:hypothetical protein
MYNICTPSVHMPIRLRANFQKAHYRLWSHFLLSVVVFDCVRRRSSLNFVVRPYLTMKRDMDLIRNILLQTEAGQPIVGEKTAVVYHIALLKEAGFVEAVIRNGPLGMPSEAVIRRLTWAGHDFLDAMRDETIWKKAKDKFIKPGVSWTVSILAEWLKQEARRRFFPDPESS